MTFMAAEGATGPETLRQQDRGEEGHCRPGLTLESGLKTHRRGESLR